MLAQYDNMVNLRDSYNASEDYARTHLSAVKYAELQSLQLTRTQLRAQLKAAQASLETAEATLKEIGSSEAALQQDVTNAKDAQEAAQTAYDEALAGAPERLKDDPGWKDLLRQEQEKQAEVDDLQAQLEKDPDNTGLQAQLNTAEAELAAIQDLNPFFEMLGEGMRPFAVGLSTCAAIIASQALVTGAFSLVSEASRLDLMPHMQIFYPAETKGQLYIPMVNNVMWVGCIAVVLLFQSSAHMEAAYGLAITITMICTSILLFFFLHNIRKRKIAAWIFVIFFVALEGFFFGASLTKFFHGGYFTILMAALIMGIMVSWYNGTSVERRQATLLPIRSYLGQLDSLRNDETYELMSDNLVYLTNETNTNYLDRDILYSILDKHPKRARAYWFLNVEVMDEPHTFSYSVETFGTDYVFRVHLYLGYKVNQRVNAYLRQVVSDLSASGELPPQTHEYSVYKKPGPIGSFRFCMLRKMLAPESDVDSRERSAIALKYTIRRFAGSPARWFGLESSSVFYEYVPLFTKFKEVDRMTRIDPNTRP